MRSIWNIGLQKYQTVWFNSSVNSWKCFMISFQDNLRHNHLFIILPFLYYLFMFHDFISGQSSTQSSTTEFLRESPSSSFSTRWLLKRNKNQMQLFLFRRKEEENAAISFKMCIQYLENIWTWMFLAVQNSSLGDLVTQSLTQGTFTSDIREWS